MDKKKFATAAVLVLIIAATVVFVVKMASGGGTQVRPVSLKTSPINMIDKDTFEMFLKPENQWEKVTNKEGWTQNPKTGKYTLRPSWNHRKCTMSVPKPFVLPKGLSGTPEGWICPLCGNTGTPDFSKLPADTRDEIQRQWTEATAASNMMPGAEED